MKDFDALWKEQRKKGAEFVLYGKKHKLPAGLPAKTALFMAKIDKEQEIEGDLMEKLCFDVFGEDNVKGWFQKGLLLNELEELFYWAIEEMAGKNSPAPVAEKMNDGSEG